MAAMRYRVRRVARWSATLLFAALLAVANGGSVLDHARAAGWSEPAGEQAATFLKATETAVAGPLFDMLFGLVLGVAATLWMEHLSRGRSRRAVAGGGRLEAGSDNEGSVRRWSANRDDDAGDELAVIDEAIDIFGPGMKLENALRRARRVHAAWEKEIAQGRYEEYLQSIKDCRQDCWKQFLEINRIYRDNDRHAELRSILSMDDVLLNGQSNRFFHAFANFVENVKMLGSGPSEESLRLLRVHADTFADGIEDLERWQTRVNDALLDRRQEL